MFSLLIRYTNFIPDSRFPIPDSRFPVPYAIPYQSKTLGFFIHRITDIENNHKFSIGHQPFKSVQMTLRIRPVAEPTNNDSLHLG
ncbi:MAG: hypothetical protein F6J98_24565 [Moorea sp. SIO4G2]|nr:hypothetical protein [Moorena sp. SIO4G2]